MNDTPRLSFRQRLLQLILLTIQHIAITAACMICLHVVLVWCSDSDPVVELSVHASAHVLLVALLVLPVLWWTGHKRTACVCSIPTAYLLFLVQPWIFIPSEAKPRQEVMRVLCWNVWASNDAKEEMESVIRHSKPDVLIIVELNPKLVEQMSWLVEDYPYRQELPSFSGSGIGVFCRHDNVQFETQAFGFKSQPAIVASFTSDDGKRHVDLVAMHTYSPTPPRRALRRDEQLRTFIDWSSKQSQPICLAGDLNTTPWSKSFLELIAAGFKDSRRGVGNCASWPAWFGPAGIPIDHALTLGECTITNRKVIPVVAGSDHRPIQFDLSY